MAHNIHRHLQYNAWANGKLAEFLSAVDEKHFYTEVKSSFPSLQKTILHIRDAETIWLERLKGESLFVWPGADFNGTITELLSSYTEASATLRDFAAAQPDGFLNTLITYMNTAGKEFTNEATDMLFHVVNHSSFHRGQLITLMRELGYTKFESTDLISWMRLHP